MSKVWSLLPIHRTFMYYTCYQNISMLSVCKRCENIFGKMFLMLRQYKNYWYCQYFLKQITGKQDTKGEHWVTMLEQAQSGKVLCIVIASQPVFVFITGITTVHRMGTLSVNMWDVQVLNPVNIHLLYLSLLVIYCCQKLQEPFQT